MKYFDKVDMKVFLCALILIGALFLIKDVMENRIQEQKKAAIKTKLQALKKHYEKQEELKYIVLDRDMVIRKGQKDAPGIKGYSMFLTKGARIYFKKE